MEGQNVVRVEGVCYEDRKKQKWKRNQKLKWNQKFKQKESEAKQGRTISYSVTGREMKQKEMEAEVD